MNVRACVCVCVSSFHDEGADVEAVVVRGAFGFECFDRCCCELRPCAFPRPRLPFPPKDDDDVGAVGCAGFVSDGGPPAGVLHRKVIRRAGTFRTTSSL